MFSEEEANYIIHEYTIGEKKEYQLSIGNENDLQFLRFPRTGEMATISDSPNITRLFGEMSEDTRSGAWLSFEGETLEPEEGQNSGIYKIYDTGRIRIGNQTEKYSELFFSGSKMSDRWILRKLPNPFDRALFSSENIYLLWKPPLQKSYNQANSSISKYKEIICPCSNKEISAKFHELVREEGVETISKLSSDVIFNPDSKTFNGIGAAEGTWIDMFGEKYVYTKEFITHLYNEQRERLKNGETIKVGGDEHTDGFNGTINNVKLHTQPVYHIEVEGIYHGPSKLSNERYGLSYENRLRSVWNEEFQAWIPFGGSTDAINVVRKPACKICWINKVN